MLRPLGTAAAAAADNVLTVLSGKYRRVRWTWQRNG